MKLKSILNEEQTYDLEQGLPQELEIGDMIVNGPAAPRFVVGRKENVNGTIVYTAFSDRKYSMNRGDKDGEDIDLKFTIEDGRLVPLNGSYKGII